MKKKELKQRIKELEAENLLLRTMAMQPIYIYLYRQLPYNPWWEYFLPQPYRLLQPIGPVTYEPNTTWGKSGGTQTIDGSWQTGSASKYITDLKITGSQIICRDHIGMQ